MKKLMFAASAIAVLSSQLTFASSTIPPELIKKAQQEGEVVSVGMPDSWANWKETWQDLKTKYGIQHQDTDMSSAQEIARFASEKHHATADIGDIGFGFAKIAKQKNILLPYKPTTWNDIPNWAKDPDGYWAMGYTGTIAFIINNKLVKNIPHSWHDLLKGHYRVSLGDVGSAAQANNAILACAYANGGSEKNIEPALKFFAELAKQGRLSPNGPSLANLEKGEVEVGVMWDFNALNYRDKIDRSKFTVLIPSDGSVTSGYVSIINKYAPHPWAAKLTREYIFSDAGQINLARGYARPIRTDVKLPADAKSKLLPNSEYKHAHPIRDFKAWRYVSSRLPQEWQSQVMIYQH
ncbi:Sulfate-binding protein precursor [Marinomonas spartinae]|uniref:Sulfate-binding protein n=1 Tax=Marinomonas spartinae TaxID=1792290 RepID=A0A1A8T2V5_9GAMM|nr:extracellular solute-binding protein [Marinomonas spartinae]SBS24695.1 Sulfate-binding protein precursor [Marinomonas spartinae]SBS25330.1 Sulfate-binding protein precursor [Marinomonas spartinae]